MPKLLTLLLTALFSLSPLAAQAHDEIVGSSPAAQSTVEAGPVTVQVTFEENILKSSGNQGLVIEVTDPNGSKVSNGCVEVSGATLSTSVDLDEPGTYLVKWRSVGADGHAVEGSFNFELLNTSNYQSSGIPEKSAECAALQSEVPTEDSTPLIGLAIAIGLVVLGSVAGALRFGRKPKG